MRVLITGISGLLGSHLAEYLLEAHPEVEVFGLRRWRSDRSRTRKLAGRITLLEGDIEDAHSVRAVIEHVRPDWLFHLAAQSYPAVSWDAPLATLTPNIAGTVNVLEAVRHCCPACQVHVAGSSAQYGYVAADSVPIREDHPMRPLSPYGVSKVAQELLACQYHAVYGLRTYVTRSFNHVGPGQDERTAIQSFCRQVAAIELGLQPPVVRVGNLAPRRDFLDARDAVRALWALMERGTPGEAYNLCSGTAPTMREVLEEIISQARCSMEVFEDPGRLRPSDEPILLGDNTKLRKHTGWTPTIDLRQMIARVLDHWRSTLRVEALLAQSPSAS